MSTDLTLVTARADRDALADRTDVLDKVGALRMLPDDMHVTTEMLAEFYAVPVKTIQTTVLRNREELDDDGYRVVTRAAFEETFTMKVTSSASTFALFPRRAVLRVGMLLRDSTVAREVRDYLLDAEVETRPVLSDDEIIHRALELTTAKIAELEPKARKFDNFLSAKGDYDVNETAKVLQRAGIDTGEKRLFGAMQMTLRWVYRDHKGRPRAYQAAIAAGYVREKPQGQYIDDDTGGVILRTPQVRVTPKGIDKLIEKMRSAA